MNALARITIAVAVLLMASAGARSQALTKESNGSISGRITLGGQGLPGVVVGVQAGEPVPIRPTAPMVKATTDQDGRYRLTGLAAGRYSVAPAAP
jgi:hypothetical protein